MQKFDVPELSLRLAQLADSLPNGKAPSPAGLLVWQDALSVYAFDDVKAVLTDWPKFNNKMPAPSDIRKTCQERVQSRAQREQAVSGKALAPSFQNANSAVAKRELAKIKDILGDCSGALVAGTWRHISGRSTHDPLDWARVLRVRHEADEAIGVEQIAAYRAALKLSLVAA